MATVNKFNKKYQNIGKIEKNQEMFNYIQLDC